MSRFILVRESCAGRREASGEALTAVRVGRAIEHRNTLVRSAEAFTSVEGNTGGPVRGQGQLGSAVSENPRHARTTHAGTWEASPLPGRRCATVAKVKRKAKRRMHGGEESDRLVVVMKRANKARVAARRSPWSEGVGATGDAKGRPCSEHRVGKPQEGYMRVRNGAARRSSGLPSQPERGAGCASAPVRICAGGAGQPASYRDKVLCHEDETSRMSPRAVRRRP